MFKSLFSLVSVLNVIFVFVANRFHSRRRCIWLINSRTAERTG